MIHPRRLKGSSGNIARYFTVEEHYTKGRGETSRWGGRIAGELGLSGSVDREMFQQLLDGRVCEQRLGRHRSDGTNEHHPGWDFAVNAPKSVSIMALVMGDERILAAHEKAADTALAYLEEHAELRRRDSGEIVHETTGRLLFARFTEHVSRELDPHLHTHVVVMNMTNGEVGKPMASLETRAMFVEQMASGQIYRNELAQALRAIGYGLDSDPRSGLFEIRGVPRDLITDMSKRAEQIDAHAREHGLEGQAARRRSFYETRRAKHKAGAEELRGRWTSRAAPHRRDLDALRAAAVEREAELGPAAIATAARAMLFGIRQAEGREAVNNLGQMYRAGLASHVGEVRLADLVPLAAEHQRRAKLLSTHQPTGDQILTRGRTTRQTARRELAFVHQLALAIDDARPITEPEQLVSILEAGSLNAAQEHALRFVGTSKDRLVGVHGVAGAGKSTLVKALVDVAEPDIQFVALAPTSSAAANLGQGAGIASRTVASLLASGGRDLQPSHVMVLDEAGQLGNRQAERLLEISRLSGARLILLGDNKQTGAIEQGKPFWLLQQLGLPTAQLSESVRQETRAMKAAVTQARLGDYAASLSNLDKVVGGDSAEALAKNLVAEWTRLKPANRGATNILVLENATRLIVNDQIRQVLKREGAIAAEDTRLQILAPSGMSATEKRFARFYSGGQVVRFARDIAGAGLARDTDYRVAGIATGPSGRQLVRLIDEQGREICWDPRIGQTARVNVFRAEERVLAAGDRIQWRLASRELGLKNAERGTVEAIDGTNAAIRWDRGNRRERIDLSEHRTWDHGFSETVYSAQSKTYDRVYVLAPVNSPLVNGQNYYTAITRARFGVKLWTEDIDRLADRLVRNSGEKSSALEGLGQLGKNGERSTPAQDNAGLDRLRKETRAARQLRDQRCAAATARATGPAARLAERAREIVERVGRFLATAPHGARRADPPMRTHDGGRER